MNLYVTTFFVNNVRKLASLNRDAKSITGINSAPSRLNVANMVRGMIIQSLLLFINIPAVNNSAISVYV